MRVRVKDNVDEGINMGREERETGEREHLIIKMITDVIDKNTTRGNRD